MVVVEVVTVIVAVVEVSVVELVFFDVGLDDGVYVHDQRVFQPSTEDESGKRVLLLQKKTVQCHQHVDTAPHLFHVKCTLKRLRNFVSISSTKFVT